MLDKVNTYPKVHAKLRVFMDDIIFGELKSKITRDYENGEFVSRLKITEEYYVSFEHIYYMILIHEFDFEYAGLGTSKCLVLNKVIKHKKVPQELISVMGVYDFIKKQGSSEEDTMKVWNTLETIISLLRDTMRKFLLFRLYKQKTYETVCLVWSPRLPDNGGHLGKKYLKLLNAGYYKSTRVLAGNATELGISHEYVLELLCKEFDPSRVYIECPDFCF